MSKMNRTKMINLLALLSVSLLLSGCSMWPYKRDFDCPVPEGERCKSLYEVHKMADQGKYDPNNPNNQIDHIEKTKNCGKRNCKSRSN
jgi:hypothetical protein